MYPDRDASYVYEHLKYFLSKYPRLDRGIDIAIQPGGTAIVIREQKILRIAKELGHRTVRAIVSLDSADADVAVFQRRTGASMLDVSALEQESNSAVSLEWHVFFFARPLTLAERERFVQDMSRSFEPRASMRFKDVKLTPLTVDFTHDGLSAEFEAWTPVGEADHEWIKAFIERYVKFSETVAPIVSYRGLML